MAFTLQTWARASVSANEPTQTLPGNIQVGCNRGYNYTSLADAQAVIAGASYFDTVNWEITTGDWLFAYSIADGAATFYTFVNTDGVITTVPFNLVNTVNTNNIVDGAVTAVKMAANTITDTQVSLNGLTSLSMNKSFGQFLSGQLSSANIQAMYGAPIVLLPAPGANRVIVVDQFTCQLQFNAVQYTGGGAVGLQYGAAAANPHLAGPAASATFANGVNVNICAAQSQVVSVAGALSNQQLANLANTAVCISNDTAAFAAGNSVVNWYIKYSVYTTT